MNNFGVGSADGFENSPVTLSVTKGLIVGVGGFRRPVLRFFALLRMTQKAVTLSEYEESNCNFLIS